jgi:hypothetical protein
MAGDMAVAVSFIGAPSIVAARVQLRTAAAPMTDIVSLIFTLGYEDLERYLISYPWMRVPERERTLVVRANIAEPFVYERQSEASR